jgi:hypothetical protein
MSRLRLATKDSLIELQQLERQLIQSRRELADSRVALLDKAHVVLTSPKTLGAAFGIGFVIGEITYCKKPKASASSLRQNAKAGRFQSLTQTLALGYSMLNAWPVTALLNLVRKPTQTQSMGGDTADITSMSTDLPASTNSTISFS